MNTVDFIIAAVKWYVGRTEKKGNSGFHDAGFQKEMEAAGWYNGGAWCAFWANMVWRKAFKSNEALYKLTAKLDSGSAMQTFKNYQKDGTFETGDTPRLGAKVIWSNGKGPSGHQGIVIGVNLATNTMTTVEGNTNAAGSREGDCVAIKLRTIERPFKETGLNVVGYVYPQINEA